MGIKCNDINAVATCPVGMLACAINMVECADEDYGPLYRRLKVKAASQGCSVKEPVLRGVQAEIKGRKSVRRSTKITLPIIASKRPGWLQLTNSQIDEILFP